MDLSGLNELIKINVMKNSLTNSRSQSSSNNNVGRFLYPANTNTTSPSEEIFQANRRVLPIPVSAEGFAEINRCFTRVNRKVEGYLDIDELKEFMKLRRCPITDWEATKLLQYADPMYHYYISLDQILELTTLYGIGTTRPVQMTQSQFDTAIKHAFRLTSTNSFDLDPEDVIDFNGALNYFESKAAQARENEKYEEALDEYRQMARENLPNSRLVMNPEDFVEKGTSESSSSFQYPKDSAEDAISKTAVIEEPQELVTILRKQWEYKISGNKKSKVDMNSIPVPAPFPHSSNNIDSILKSKTVECFSVNKSSSTTGLESPAVKSIYARTDLFKIFSEIEPSSMDKALGVIIQSQKSHGNREQYPQASQAPPLPPPIIPDIPAEWFSNRKI